jgi:hypothetical protein
MKSTDQSDHREADLCNAAYGGARAVIQAENEHIKNWRGEEPRAGIALSGGGIRSASFGLGILQALAKGEWLREFDYLSTVSGGGYTGSSLSYLLHLSRTKNSGGVPKFDVSQDDFPYLSYPMVGAHHANRDGKELKKGALLRRLRQNAKYLSPGHSITVLSLLGVVLRNSIISIVVHMAVIMLILQALIAVHFIEPGQPLAWRMNLATWFCVGVFGSYLVLSMLYVILTRCFDALSDQNAVYSGRRLYEQTVNWLFVVGIVCFVIAALPWMYAVVSWVEQKDYSFYSFYAGLLSSAFGVGSSVWAFLQSSDVKKSKVSVGLVVAVASTLLLIGVLLLALFCVVTLERFYDGWMQVSAVVALLFAVGWIPSVNYVSVHRYYRDRLMETFMPDRDGIKNPEMYCGRTYSGNETMLGAVCGVEEMKNNERRKNKRKETRRERKNCGPYHLINSNVVLVSSDNPRYRGRGGDSFVFSPLFTGSQATEWVRTDPSPGEGMTLATAMAISGAAVNPNAGCGGDGVTRMPVLSVLMSLLNIRLGYWSGNPKRSRWLPIRLKPNMIYPGLAESFGRFNLHEKSRYVLLTDGGHFENLGLYELIRRRLKVIVVCDGAADPNYSFNDLANALEKARADFGALVDISSADLDDLVPHPIHKEGAKGASEMPMAKRAYLVAPIRYAPLPGRRGTAAAKEECGLLIYITTTFFKELNASLHGYRQSHPAFPDEPTSDQFFDEKQFESYRELGYQTAWQLMNELSAGKKRNVVLNGVAFPGINAAKKCREVPSPFQKIRQEIRGRDRKSANRK